jgi:hypothetical protein
MDSSASSENDLSKRETAPLPDGAHTPGGDTSCAPTFSRQEWLRLFIRGEHETLCDEFLRILNHFAKTSYYNLSAGQRSFVNDFVENFLYFFCHPDLKVPAGQVQAFIGLHPIIANVVAISDFGTTTPWVVRLARHKENYFKLLALYNVRSAVDIDSSLFFDVSPLIASQWWTYFWISAPAFCLKETYERIRAHLLGLDHRFMIFGTNARASYFPVTYVAPEYEQIGKGRLNRLAAEAFANVKIRNKPLRRKIALITDRWYRSAVYTSLSPLIRSLAGRYDLTLIHNGTDEKEIMDRAMFERTMCIQMKNSQMDLEPLQDNDFSAAIYPDIGMNPESIYLSNIRIAPVQIVMYGHPTSTWSPQIDYFIGGRKVENLANASRDFGERLVVIPGMGVYPVYPDDFTPPPETKSETPFVINCGWTAQKVSYPLLATLQKVIEGAKKAILFQIFPGNALTQYNGFIPFVKDVQSMLGAQRVRVLASLSRLDYLGELCKGAFSIDSYPFGGFNTVIDALYCKKPMVVWQGDRAFNRFGGATLEIAGMEELIARTQEEYISCVLRLINDDDFRRTMCARAAALDLKAAFAKHENPAYYLKAIDYLIDNHDRLKAEGSREPIIIE